MIIFSGHLGNWEIAALAAGQYGVDVAQIYRAANNPLVDRLIARLRGDGGEFIPKGAVASRRAVARSRRGAHLTLLVDQKMNDGIPVPFFGRTAMTAPGAGLAGAALRLRRAAGPGRAPRRRAFPPDRVAAAAAAARQRHRDAAVAELTAGSTPSSSAGSASAPSNGSGCTGAGRISPARRSTH